MDKLIQFLKAKDEAFEDKGIEFGQVEFSCPICLGDAWAIKAHTPNNIAHKTTIRAACEKCGISMMN